MLVAFVVTGHLDGMCIHDHFKKVGDIGERTPSDVRLFTLTPRHGQC